MKYTFTILFFIILSSCTHMPPAVSANDLSKLDTQASGIVLSVRLQNETTRYGNSSCELSFRKIGTPTEYEVEINPGKNTTFVALPEGRYQIHELYCGGNGHWDLSLSSFTEFTSFSGKLSAVYPMDFVIQDDSSITYSERKHDEDRMFNMKDHLSKKNRSRLVSAYNGATAL